MTKTGINKQLADDLKVAGRDAAELMASTAGKAQAAVSRIRDRVDKAIQSTKDNVQRAQEKTVAASQATDQCVRAHPYQTIGVFFGLGVLAGILWARK